MGLPNGAFKVSLITLNTTGAFQTYGDTYLFGRFSGLSDGFAVLNADVYLVDLAVNIDSEIKQGDEFGGHGYLEVMS